MNLKQHVIYSCCQIFFLLSSSYFKPKQNAKQEQLNFQGEGRDAGYQGKSVTFMWEVCLAHSNTAPLSAV